MADNSMYQQCDIACEHLKGESENLVVAALSILKDMAVMATIRCFHEFLC